MSHTTHCCKKHGCKYGDKHCPVEEGLIEQQGPCEQCGLEEEGYYGSDFQASAYAPTTPVKKDVVDLLESCLAALQFAKHPDFGKPELLIRRIKEFLGRPQ